MKKADLNVIKASVEGRLELADGIKVDLGPVNAKEEKSLAKAFKPFAGDPVVKAALKAESFARWVGSIEQLEGSLLSILEVIRFSKRSAFVLPSDKIGELTAMPKSALSPEYVRDLFHVADVCSAKERDKLICKADTEADLAANWRAMLANCGPADREFLDLALNMIAKDVTKKLPKILNKSLDLAAVMVAVIDEELHTECGSTAPVTQYRVEAPTERAATWVNRLITRLASRNGMLRWKAESDRIFLLGPEEGAAETITLPLEEEPIVLAKHELDTVSQMVRLCVTPPISDSFLQRFNAVPASVLEDTTYKSCTEGELWRMCLVGLLPVVALGEQRARTTVTELERLEGFLWRYEV